MDATPTKLSTGEWGARVTGKVKSGDTVTIKTRSGKTWDARIVDVLSTREGVSTCSTKSLDGPKRQTSTGCYRCRATATRRTQIWEDCDSCGTEPIYI